MLQSGGLYASEKVMELLARSERELAAHSSNRGNQRVIGPRKPSKTADRTTDQGKHGEIDYYLNHLLSRNGFLRLI